MYTHMVNQRVGTVAAAVKTDTENSTLSVHMKKVIGKGSFGHVRYCRAVVNDERVGFAVKIINKHSLMYYYNKEAVDREVSILKKIHHPNLVLFIKIVDYGHYVYMYMECCKYICHLSF